MSKRPSFSTALKTLEALRSSPSLNTSARPAEPPAPPLAPEGLPEAESSILAQSPFNTDSIPEAPCPSKTVSIPISVESGQAAGETVCNADTDLPKTGPTSNGRSVRSRQRSSQTVSKTDPARSEPPPSETVSNGDSVPFTKVPHSLLRQAGAFADPLDFMVYLHLFTFSHGYGRRDAHMSQSQLERFTGAAKNTIKRSLARLSKQGWIKCIETYEHARMSRKWRVYTPEDHGGPRGRRGSKAETVSDAQCPVAAPTLSNSDTVTLSRTDPFIESIPKEKSKNSLSRSNAAEMREQGWPEPIRNYLASIRPERKRNAEIAALNELITEFTATEIEGSLVHLLEHGLPGKGEPVHSPFCFLASGGIESVLEQIETVRRERELSSARARHAERETQNQELDDARAAKEAARKEAAFLKTFPTEAAQSDVIEEYRSRFPGLSPGGIALRKLVIHTWWNEVGQDTMKMGVA